MEPPLWPEATATDPAQISGVDPRSRDGRVGDSALIRSAVNIAWRVADRPQAAQHDRAEGEPPRRLQSGRVGRERNNHYGLGCPALDCPFSPGRAASSRRIPTSSVCAGEPTSLMTSTGTAWVSRLSRVRKRMR